MEIQPSRKFWGLREGFIKTLWRHLYHRSISDIANAEQELDTDPTTCFDLHVDIQHIYQHPRSIFIASVDIQEIADLQHINGWRKVGAGARTQVEALGNDRAED